MCSYFVCGKNHSIILLMFHYLFLYLNVLFYLLLFRLYILNQFIIIFRFQEKYNALTIKKININTNIYYISIIFYFNNLLFVNRYDILIFFKKIFIFFFFIFRNKFDFIIFYWIFIIKLKIFNLFFLIYMFFYIMLLIPMVFLVFYIK